MNERSLEILEHFYQEVIIPIKLGPLDLSVTNLTLSMWGAALLAIVLLLWLGFRPRKVPGKRQLAVEMLIGLVKKNMVYNFMGKKDGDRWWPFIFSLFIFILFNNLIGIVPGVYVPTSNPLLPLTLAVMVFLTVQITNLAKNGFKGYIRTFAPSYVPGWMYVIVFPIEIISTLAKPFSLFIRLTANILAGHTIIYVLLGLIIYFKNYFVAVAAIPFAAAMAMLENIYGGHPGLYICHIVINVYRRSGKQKTLRRTYLWMHKQLQCWRQVS
ncbi:MAG: F0F1 ATP synthase subunit A [Actinomycetota bacterium]|nr:F0F1 ATP synthase subunit A [Actinomycetota bacterium]